MHIKKVLFTSVCVLSLSACGLTPQEMAQIQQQRYEQSGQQQTIDLASDGKTPKQIPVEKVLPVFPRGYTAHLPKRLLKPQGAVQVAAVQPSQDDIEPAPIPPLPEVAAVTAPPAAQQAVAPTPASTPAPTPSLSSQPVASPLPPVVAATETPVIQQTPADFVPAQPISLTSAASRPEPALAATAPSSAPSSVVWHEISDYNPNNFAAEGEAATPASAAPAADAAPVGKRYNKNVTVFMPDDETSYVAPSDFEPATVVISSAGTQNATAPVVLTPPPADESQKAQQLFFSHASAVIKPGDKKELRRIAGDIKSDASHVTVIGHASARVDHVTDPVEKKMINFRMAQKRAEAVTREMEKSGVSPDWVEAVSRGDEEPNPEAGDMTQEAADRRVDVFVTRASGK